MHANHPTLQLIQRRPVAPIAGMIYFLWLRARWSLLMIGVALTASSFIAQAFPHAEWRVFVGVTGASAIAMSLAHLVAVVTYSERDLSAAESGFPQFSFVLPVPSALMASVPMCCAVVVFTLAWTLTARIIVNPIILRGGDQSMVSLWWPGLMLAAAITGLQATSWSPFWVPFVRVLASLGVLAAVAAVGIVGTHLAVAQSLLAGAFAVLILLFFQVAIIGVARARRGDGVISRRRGAATAGRAAAPRKPGFKSGLSAQTWFEIRRNILLVPCFGAGFPLMMAVVSVLGSRDSIAIPIGPFMVDPIVVMLIVAIASPVFAGGIHGGTLGKSDAWARSPVILPFIAIRPLTTFHLVAAKFRAAAVVTLVTWAMVLLILAGWLAIPHKLATGQWVSDYLSVHATRHVIFTAMVVLGWLLVLTWKQLAQNMYISLYGRQWLATAAPIAGAVLVCAFPPAGIWIAKHERLRHLAAACMPAIIYVLAAMKLTLGAWILRASLHRGVLLPKQIWRVAGAWGVLVALALESLYLVFPAGTIPMPQLICLAMLLPPGVRCLVALPALYANRHR